jgi:UPF0716 family protein affecting phage T7 exclusion
MILALFPLAFLICLTVFALLLVLTGIVSVGSIGAALTLPLAVLFFGGGTGGLRRRGPHGNRDLGVQPASRAVRDFPAPEEYPEAYPG